MNKTQLIEKLTAANVAFEEKMTKGQLHDLLQNHLAEQNADRRAELKNLSEEEMTMEEMKNEEVITEGVELTEEQIAEDAVEPSFEETVDALEVEIATDLDVTQISDEEIVSEDIVEDVTNEESEAVPTPPDFPVTLDINDVENPVIGDWYVIDGVVKQYEAPTEEVEIVEEVLESSDEVPGETVNTDDSPSGEQPIEEETTSKRKVGKGVDWYKNGVLHMQFPSIKACATFIKEEKGLKHMPFTPIMKSIRTDVDWNESSFRFVGQDAPAVPVTNPQSEDKPAEDTVNEDTGSDIEEIVEVTEEIIEETTEQPSDAEQTA